MTTLTDLSQLTKSMVKKPVEEPKPAPTPKMQEPPVDREAAEVLAYFARPGGNAPHRAHVASRADPAKDRVTELEAALEAKDTALDALAEEKSTMDGRIADLERQLAKEREAHAAAVRERDRLQGECGRLRRVRTARLLRHSPEKSANRCWRHSRMRWRRRSNRGVNAAPGCWRVCWRLTLRPANSNADGRS